MLVDGPHCDLSGEMERADGAQRKSHRGKELMNRRIKLIIRGCLVAS